MARITLPGKYAHKLPKGKTEPYRLWFEYLQLAQRYPGVSVNGSVYADWGDVKSIDFEVWWKDHWRLFMTSANVKIVASAQTLHHSLSDPDIVVVAIHRSGTESQKLHEVKNLLRLRFQSGGNMAKNKQAYEVTAKRSIHYPSLLAMLRFLEMHRLKPTLEDATVAFKSWADAWNARAKDLKRRKVTVPKTLLRFAREIALHEDELQRFRRAKQSREFNIARSDAKKFLNQAERVLKNVAAGQFPGKY